MKLALPPDCPPGVVKLAHFVPDEPPLDETPKGAAASGISVDDFYAVMTPHSYIYTPTRELWPASSVNARIPPIVICDDDGEPVLDHKGEPEMMAASKWLDKYRPVEQMTWSPGLPMLIRDRLIQLQGGWIDKNGVSCFNLYHPPTIEPGDASKAGPWLDHVRRVYGDDADHIIQWFAHRVQHPQQKCNHALVLGGAQGIGKDSLLEPVKHAVGPWNFSEVSPQQMLGRFNGFAKSVILRISEARDLGDVNRFAFYDHSKVYCAAPPDVLRVDEKNLREHAVPNVMGVVFTTNHKGDGLFLPADDRRHFVGWSNLTKESFPTDYWNKLWSWYSSGGIGHVAAYLAKLNLSAFDAKAPPPKTPAFWDIVDANRAPEDAELADLLDAMDNPDAVTLDQIKRMASGDIVGWLSDVKHRRAIPHRLERCGYAQVRNDNAKSDGLWKISGKRQAVYAKSGLSLKDRINAAKSVASV